ncbi:hypothetical protein [Orientia tsutsugamushi]|uniref:Putative signal transduction histidine kinase n=1 Tax=Orientia tsutsugamushi str. TA716 TaxID=1359175 RepID=A0A0F3NWU6_ORITS|nr:hypothetical protein [Orientia tsutsugamushi]KJV72545.1 putative signal transduction histidine kinase [Orientia tsutsugamushi str. TA716]
MSIGNEGQQKNKSIQSKLLLRHLAAGDKELLKFTHQLKTLNLNIIDVFKQLKSESEDVRTLQSEITENKKPTLSKSLNSYREALGLSLTFVKLMLQERRGEITMKSEENKYTEGICHIPISLADS